MQTLRAIFVRGGFNIWLVGGAVRDFMRGEDPKDLDFATDATPEEQVKLYNDAGVRFIPTGLQHGTVTVVLDDEPLEITSLRIDVETDGRHATVEFTRSIEEDLARRDLTINAMAMDFDGKLIDPYGGAKDLKDGRVRFVGNAEQRMSEDYLRILRYFRFQGRMASVRGGKLPFDPEAIAAIRKVRGGLGQISVERIWAEMSKIITGRYADVVVSQMRDLALFEIIGMPVGFIPALRHAANRGVTDPASVMGWYVTETSSIDQIANQWKWSGEERARAKFIAENGATKTERRMKEMLVEGEPFEWVADLMRLNNMDPQSLANWPVPKLPVSGRDLIQAGVKPGPNMGTILSGLNDEWVNSEFRLTREELMQKVANDQ